MPANAFFPRIYKFVFVAKVKMLHKWLKYILMLLLMVFVPQIVAGDDKYLAEFENEVESLLLDATDEALLTSANIYRNLSTNMSAQLREATKPLIDNYLEAVNRTLLCRSNYTEKRIILRYYRIDNWKIECLRMELQPDLPKFQFQVISKDFYFGGRNTTIFDNLYLSFMQKFQRASETLWRNLSEEVVETEQDLLELLDEISKERMLAEKDKLYDEFIEMFLFKSARDRLETRELE